MHVPNLHRSNFHIENYLVKNAFVIFCTCIFSFFLTPSGFSVIPFFLTNLLEEAEEEDAEAKATADSLLSHADRGTAAEEEGAAGDTAAVPCGQASFVSPHPTWQCRPPPGGRILSARARPLHI